MDVKTTARKAAEGSFVLLKNEGLLPLGPAATAAFFGRTQLETIIGGNGSGAARVKDPKCILTECEKAGISDVPALKAYYEETLAANAGDNEDMFDFEGLKKAVNSGLFYELFGRYSPQAPEFEVPEQLIREAAAVTDTAVFIIGRNAGGEECDRHEENDYYLSDAEKQLIGSVCRAFPKVALIINTNGLIDLSWTKELASLKSILFIGIPGEEGPTAVANVLTGRVNPSGKLADTIAEKASDYPQWEDFSWDKDHPENIRTYEYYGLSAEENGSAGFRYSPVTVYREDIYNGYRYFDSFGVEPLYPFGFGLSYTTFETGTAQVEKQAGGLQVSAAVKNTGNEPGKEVLQLYISAEDTASAHAYQELKGFVKTGALAPGETEPCSIVLPWRELACYRESDASWVIESGRYILRLGNSSRNTEEIAAVEAKNDIVLLKTSNRLPLQACNRDKIDFLRAPEKSHGRSSSDLPVIPVTDADVPPLGFFAVPSEDAGRLTDQELAALCVGYGAGVPFAAFSGNQDPPTVFYDDGTPVTTNSHPTGYDGYVSPAMEKYGIRSAAYKDGPAGIGETAWPTEMILACSFDRELLGAMGDAIGFECENGQVDIWLAPALNLHRHPLGGRNFEYYSEDPFLAGSLGTAVIRGVQQNHPVVPCAKHLAVNEQETYRRGKAKQIDGKTAYDAVDSILTERAARELYLKPFEMAVRNAPLHSVMTSFNKINGTFAGGSKDLCTHILREEWGFDGCVVTDWGDMDMVVDGADAVAAGNDVVMPGGPPVITQILKGYEEGRVTREELETAVGHLLRMIRMTGESALRNKTAP